MLVFVTLPTEVSAFKMDVLNPVTQVTIPLSSIPLTAFFRLTLTTAMWRNRKRVKWIQSFQSFSPVVIVMRLLRS